MPKPFTHIQYFHPILKKFATYLQSQHIKYEMYDDYDGQYIHPVNSKWIFYVQHFTGDVPRLYRGKPYSYTHNDIPFPLMPTREEIIG